MKEAAGRAGAGASALAPAATTAASATKETTKAVVTAGGLALGAGLGAAISAIAKTSGDQEKKKAGNERSRSCSELRGTQGNPSGRVRAAGGITSCVHS